MNLTPAVFLMEKGESVFLRFFRTYLCTKSACLVRKQIDSFVSGVGTKFVALLHNFLFSIARYIIEEEKKRNVLFFLA